MRYSISSQVKNAQKRKIFDKTLFSKRLQGLLKTKGITNSTEFARQSDISRPALEDYLKGKKLPGAEALFKMAEALGETMEKVFTGTNSLLNQKVWEPICQRIVFAKNQSRMSWDEIEKRFSNFDDVGFDVIFWAGNFAKIATRKTVWEFLEEGEAMLEDTGLQELATILNTSHEWLTVGLGEPPKVVEKPHIAEVPLAVAEKPYGADGELAKAMAAFLRVWAGGDDFHRENLRRYVDHQEEDINTGKGKTG